MITNINLSTNKELRKIRQERTKRAKIKQSELKREQAELRKKQRPLAQRTLQQVLIVNGFVLIATVLVSAPFGIVEQQFEDGGFIGYFSAMQLCILSYLSYQVFRERALSRKNPLNYPMAVWLILSIGFAFLALDELFMIHEWLDKTIHAIGGFQETGLSDRIDDLIVGVYGIAAIRLLVHYRREFKKYRQMLPYVIIGFTLMFSMVGIDVLTNRDDILMTVFSRETTTSIMSWAFILEEGLKLFSEAFLIVAAYLCYRKAQQFNLKHLDVTAANPKPSELQESERKQAKQGELVTSARSSTGLRIEQEQLSSSGYR